MLSKAVPSLVGLSLPKHVAIIMDGNGRWAKSRGLPRLEGHRMGAKAVRMVVEEARRLGIKNLTLFSFSSENWQRPRLEVSGLMNLFRQYLDSELQLLIDNNIRLRAIGDLERLPLGVQEAIRRNQQLTESFDGMSLNLAISYGGRGEIVHAAKRLAQLVAAGELQPEQISEELFAACLYAPDIPEPDLLIRTSGEYRISNFLLWQLAYTEIVVSKAYWPAFSKEEFHACLASYAERERRFGKTSEQLPESETLQAKSA